MTEDPAVLRERVQRLETALRSIHLLTRTTAHMAGAVYYRGDPAQPWRTAVGNIRLACEEALGESLGS
jgi:hypothetical protein